MARLLLSNKVEGPYEYVFEPLVESNVNKAIGKFLSRYGYVRRILVHPCDKRKRVISLIVLDKDKRGEYKRECCDDIRLEHQEFLVDKEKIKNIITEMLKKVMEEYMECAKKYSSELII